MEYDSDESCPQGPPKEWVRDESGLVHRTRLYEVFHQYLSTVADIASSEKMEEACYAEFPDAEPPVLCDKLEKETIAKYKGPNYEEAKALSGGIEQVFESKVRLQVLRDPRYNTLFDEISERKHVEEGMIVEDLILCEDVEDEDEDFYVEFLKEIGKDEAAKKPEKGGNSTTEKGRDDEKSEHHGNSTPEKGKSDDDHKPSRARLLHFDMLGNSGYLKKIFGRAKMRKLAETFPILETQYCLRLFLYHGIEKCLEDKNGNGRFVGRRFRWLKEGLVVPPVHPIQEEYEISDIVAHGNVPSVGPCQGEEWGIVSRGSDMVIRRFVWLEGTDRTINCLIALDPDDAIRFFLSEKFGPLLGKSKSDDKAMYELAKSGIERALDGRIDTFAGNHYHWLDVVVYQNGLVSGRIHQRRPIGSPRKKSYRGEPEVVDISEMD